jgi:diguanylate cyclase (GGDEF)-like protein/PAS domain S-box-containing protein
MDTAIARAQIAALRHQLDQLAASLDAPLPPAEPSRALVDTTIALPETDVTLSISAETFLTSLETMLDAFGIYSAMRDETGKIVDFRIDYVNTAACLSNQLSREQQVGKRLLEILPGHIESDLFAAYCHLVETGQPLSREALIYSDTYGEQQMTRAFDVRASRLGDGFVAAWRDITARKQAEIQLDANQSFIQSITELLPTAIYIFDLNSLENVYGNRQITTLLGYSREEIQAMGRNFVPRLLHPDDQQRLAQIQTGIRNAADGEVVEQEFRLRHRDGSWRWLRCCEAVFRRDAAGQVWQSIGQVEDITARRALDEQVRFQASLLDQVADAIIATDLDFRICSWNAAAERIYGWSASEALGQPLLDLVEPRFVSENVEEILQILFSTGSWSGESEQRRRDGSWMPVQSVTTLLRNHDGKPSGTVGVCRDISERKHSERLLQKVNQRLEQAIIEAHHRTRELTQINQIYDLLQVCQNRSETAEVISLGMAELFPQHSGYLAVRQPGSHVLKLLSYWGTSQAPFTTLASEQCWALRRGRLHSVSPQQEGPRCQHSAAIPAAYHYCLPLVVQGESFGVLSLSGAVEPRSELLISVGDTIKLALANIDLREALREQATHDALTGLFNRRYLEATLPRELQRINREEGQLCVAMIDIDHFKRFNDRYGHAAGDALLREIAWVFHDGIRKSDIACRYGGEEFMIVLPGSPPNETVTRLEQICAKVRTLQIDFMGKQIGPVSISVGVAAHNGETNWVELIRAADEALYSAKNAGRDRIVVMGRP